MVTDKDVEMGGKSILPIYGSFDEEVSSLRDTSDLTDLERFSRQSTLPEKREEMIELMEKGILVSYEAMEEKRNVLPFHQYLMSQVTFHSTVQFASPGAVVMPLLVEVLSNIPLPDSFFFKFF